MRNKRTHILLTEEEHRVVSEYFARVSPGVPLSTAIRGLVLAATTSDYMGAADPNGQEMGSSEPPGGGARCIKFATVCHDTVSNLQPSDSTIPEHFCSPPDYKSPTCAEDFSPRARGRAARARSAPSGRIQKEDTTPPQYPYGGKTAAAGRAPDPMPGKIPEGIPEKTANPDRIRETSDLIAEFAPKLGGLRGAGAELHLAKALCESHPDEDVCYFVRLACLGAEEDGFVPRAFGKWILSRVRTLMQDERDRERDEEIRYGSGAAVYQIRKYMPPPTEAEVDGTDDIDFGPLERRRF